MLPMAEIGHRLDNQVRELETENKQLNDRIKELEVENRELCDEHYGLRHACDEFAERISKQ